MNMAGIKREKYYPPQVRCSPHKRTNRIDSHLIDDPRKQAINFLQKNNFNVIAGESMHYKNSTTKSSKDATIPASQGQEFDRYSSSQHRGRMITPKLTQNTHASQDSQQTRLTSYNSRNPQRKYLINFSNSSKIDDEREQQNNLEIQSKHNIKERILQQEETLFPSAVVRSSLVKRSSILEECQNFNNESIDFKLPLSTLEDLYAEKTKQQIYVSIDIKHKTNKQNNQSVSKKSQIAPENFPHLSKVPRKINANPSNKQPTTTPEYLSNNHPQTPQQYYHRIRSRASFDSQYNVSNYPNAGGQIQTNQNPFAISTLSQAKGMIDLMIIRPNQRVIKGNFTQNQDQQKIPRKLQNQEVENKKLTNVNRYSKEIDKAQPLEEKEQSQQKVPSKLFDHQLSQKGNKKQIRIARKLENIYLPEKQSKQMNQLNNIESQEKHLNNQKSKKQSDQFKIKLLSNENDEHDESQNIQLSQIQLSQSSDSQNEIRECGITPLGNCDTIREAENEELEHTLQHPNQKQLSKPTIPKIQLKLSHTNPLNCAQEEDRYGQEFENSYLRSNYQNENYPEFQTDPDSPLRPRKQRCSSTTVSSIQPTKKNYFKRDSSAYSHSVSIGYQKGMDSNSSEFIQQNGVFETSSLNSSVSSDFQFSTQVPQSRICIDVPEEVGYQNVNDNGMKDSALTSQNLRALFEQQKTQELYGNMTINEKIDEINRVQKLLNQDKQLESETSNNELLHQIDKNVTLLKEEDQQQKLNQDSKECFIVDPINIISSSRNNYEDCEQKNQENIKLALIDFSIEQNNQISSQNEHENSQSRINQLLEQPDLTIDNLIESQKTKRSSICNSGPSNNIGTTSDVLKEGWLFKHSPSLLKGWRARYFVLTPQKLFYYRDEAKLKLRGCINFQLAKCAVTDIINEKFNLTITGYKRKICLKSNAKFTSFEWINLLIIVIAQNCKQNKPCINSIKATSYFKNDLITEQEFLDIADSGDILLFETNNIAAKFQRKFTGSKYDHIGLCVNLGNRDIRIFDSQTDEGVTLSEWNDFIKENDLFEKVVLRKLQGADKSAIQEKILAFVLENIGKKYSFGFTKLISYYPRSCRDKFGNEKDPEKYFCSELIAKFLKNAELLPQNKAASAYWPISFCQEKNLALQKGASFGHEIAIILDRHRDKYEEYQEQNLNNL